MRYLAMFGVMLLVAGVMSILGVGMMRVLAMLGTEQAWFAKIAICAIGLGLAIIMGAGWLDPREARHG